MMSAEHKHYTVLEGSPQLVALAAENLRLMGWECNGELFLTKISDTVLAFQGMVNPDKNETS